MGNFGAANNICRAGTGMAQAPLRRRSFLHRLLSPLAAGSGYNPERVATDAHSSTAANDLDELSAAADAALNKYINGLYKVISLLSPFRFNFDEKMAIFYSNFKMCFATD